MDEEELSSETLDSVLKTIREAFPSKSMGLLALPSPQASEASCAVDLILTSITEAIPAGEQRERVIGALESLFSQYSEAISTLGKLTKNQQAARARAARERSSKNTDIFLAALVRLETQRSKKSRSGDAMAKEIMDDLNKALKAIGENPLQHSAIAKRIRENQSRWKEEEQRNLEFQRWLGDFLKPIRDVALEGALEDLARLARTIRSNPTIFG